MGGGRAAEQVPAAGGADARQTMVLKGLERWAGAGLERLSSDPLIYSITDFLSTGECDALMAASEGRLQRAPVVGRGSRLNSFGYVQGESEGRTSSTCTLAKTEEAARTLVERVEALTGAPATQFEAPQVGCYMPGQRFNAHYDAVEPTSPVGQQFLRNGGQRIATVIVYLNTVDEGSAGATSFKSLKLSVQPEKGKALIFFPAFTSGELDKRTLHSGEPPVGCEKWISQVWVRTNSKRRDAAPSVRVLPNSAAPPAEG